MLPTGTPPTLTLMRRAYLFVMIATMVAILFSRIRFIRDAFSTSGPAAAGAYGPDSISDPARDTDVEKRREANRKLPEKSSEDTGVTLRPAED